MDRSEEQKTVRACQAGEPEKFGELYDAYASKIYEFIYYKTHHKETAEDLTSRTFLKALEKIGTYDAARGSFSSWIYRIARNNVIDHYRARQGDIDIADVWDLAAGGDLERDLDVRQRLAEVKRYLRKLNSRQREIVMLRVWQGMSYKEIAEITDKSEAGCKMMLSRALKTLRKEMSASLFLILFFLNL